MDLEINKEVEVTEKQYKVLNNKYPYAVARREDSGRYFIMLYDNRFKREVLRVLK